MQSGRSLNQLLPPSLWARTERWTSGEVLNAIFYRADNGLKWRAIPREFRHGGVRIPPLVGEDCGSKSMMSWCDRYDRQQTECTAQLVIIDSQSVKLDKKRGEEHGLDGNKFEGTQTTYCCRCVGIGLLCYSSECGGCEGGTWGFSVVFQMYQRIVKVLADKDIGGIWGINRSPLPTRTTGGGGDQPTSR